MRHRSSSAAVNSASRTAVERPRMAFFAACSHAIAISAQVEPSTTLSGRALILSAVAMTFLLRTLRTCPSSIGAARYPSGLYARSQGIASGHERPGPSTAGSGPDRQVLCWAPRSPLPLTAPATGHVRCARRRGGHSRRAILGQRRRSCPLAPPPARSSPQRAVSRPVPGSSSRSDRLPAQSVARVNPAQRRRRDGAPLHRAGRAEVPGDVQPGIKVARADHRHSPLRSASNAGRRFSTSAAVAAAARR